MFSAGTRGADAFDAFAGTFGGVGSCAAFEAFARARALARAAHARFDPRVDPAAFRGEEPGRQPRGRRESAADVRAVRVVRRDERRCQRRDVRRRVFARRAASLTQFRRAALMPGPDTRAKAVSAVSEQTPPRRLKSKDSKPRSRSSPRKCARFAPGKRRRKTKKRRNERNEEKRRRAEAARDDDSAEDDDLDDDLENAPPVTKTPIARSGRS